MKTKVIFLSSAFIFASCNSKDPAVEKAVSVGPSEAVSMIVERVPEGDAQLIHVLRETAKEGDQVTVSGKIMGNSKPFVEGRAAFILGDTEVLTSCDEMPDDHCETPWDACCDSKEDKKRGTATIQVVDAEGRVLKEGLEGVGGLEKLATVTVTGKVAPGSSKDLLVINATAIRSGK